MARMRCYSPRTGHDHGTGVAGLALPLASGPAARRLPPEPRPPTRANTANVPASTSPAEVTVVPVAPSARLTASRSGRW